MSIAAFLIVGYQTGKTHDLPKEKKMKALIVLATVLLSAQVFARSMAPLQCSRGVQGEGDDFVQVSLLVGNVEVQFHESGLAVSSADTRVEGNTVTIPEKTVQMSGEGETWDATVSGSFVYNPADNTLNAKLTIDGFDVLANETLNCK